MTRNDLAQRPCPFARNDEPMSAAAHAFGYVEGHILCSKCGEVRALTRTLEPVGQSGYGTTILRPTTITTQPIDNDTLITYTSGGQQ